MSDWSDDGSGSAASGSSLEAPARSRPPSYSDDDDDGSFEGGGGDDVGSFASDDSFADDVGGGGAAAPPAAPPAVRQIAAVPKPRGKELRRPLRTGETDSEEESDDDDDDRAGAGAGRIAAGYESGRERSDGDDSSEEDESDSDDGSEDDGRPVRQIDATPRREGRDSIGSGSSFASPLSASPPPPSPPRPPAGGPKGRGKELRRKPQLDTSSSEEESHDSGAGSDADDFATPPPKKKTSASASKSKAKASVTKKQSKSAASASKGSAAKSKAKGSSSAAKSKAKAGSSASKASKGGAAGGGNKKKAAAAAPVVSTDDGSAVSKHGAPSSQHPHPEARKSREVHSGPAPDAGEGWTMKIFERNASSTCEGKLDRFWYSPSTGRKFRSLGEVRKFQAALEAVGGDDEDRAWKVFSDRKKGIVPDVPLAKSKGGTKRKSAKKKKQESSSEESDDSEDEEVIATAEVIDADDSDGDTDDEDAVAVAVVAEPVVAEPVVSLSSAVTTSGRKKRSRKPSAKAIENAAGGLLDDEPGSRQKGRSKAGAGKGGKKKTPAKGKGKTSATKKKGATKSKATSSKAKAKSSKSKSKKKKVESSSESDSDSDSSSCAMAPPRGKHPRTPEGQPQPPQTSSASVAQAVVVPAEKLDAAEKARALLRQSVPSLPAVMSETHTVRNFGRIKVEGDGVVENNATGDGDGVALAEALFSSASALHPVGYSCDRYEFSPAHGRVLKMRCDILDGEAIRKRREEAKKKGGNDEKSGGKADEKKGSKSNDCDDKKAQDDELGTYDGPIFRIMWGRGIDEHNDGAPFPFDLYSSCPPLGNAAAEDGCDAVAVPLGENGEPASATAAAEMIKPEKGMRVSVRFDEDQWYGGFITKVTKPKDDGGSAAKKGKKSKKSKKSSSAEAAEKKKYTVKIQYDDGAKEEASYPDPDIVLRPPGADLLDGGAGAGSESGAVIQPSEIRGKAVTSVSGKTAIEAWGKALCKIGLIDEVTLEDALGALEEGRERGVREAKEVLETKKRQRQEARARSAQRQRERSGSVSGSVKAEDDDDDRSTVSDALLGTPQKEGNNASKTDSANLNGDSANNGGVREPPSAREEELRRKLQSLLRQHEQSIGESRTITDTLAQVRISALGPFLLNPFSTSSTSATSGGGDNAIACNASSQFASWLATVVRKEKTRMGSTGSKRKIVSATDLLERNNTFFDDEVERLVEGLPGTEFCPGYVFRDLRAGGAAGASFAWVHEAEIKHEKERQKKLKKTKEAKKREKAQEEREAKKRRVQEEREERKRAKLEEEEMRRKAREEERLSRLSAQVDNRLFKEACFQREKVVQAAAKAATREFARRRKAAEVLSGHAAERMLIEASDVADDRQVSAGGDDDDAFLRQLPPLSTRLYESDVLRLWDFIASFGDVFGCFTSVPTLDALHDALRAVGKGKPAGSIKQSDEEEEEEDGEEDDRKGAIDLLTGLAVALCRPLSNDLVRLLSSVTVTSAGAAVPATALEKVGGAMGGAFDLNAYLAQSKDGTDALNFDYFPVTSVTWREVARLSLMEDMLTEFGFSKQECAHTLRGFRSGGHPNSKEAKRLRRGEDLALSMLRQTVSEGAERILKKRGGGNGPNNNAGKFNGVKVRITAPCKPSATPKDWVFYLHNVKSLPPNAATAIKANLRKALNLLKHTLSDNDVDMDMDEPLTKAKAKEDKKKAAEKSRDDLQKSLSVFERIGTKGAFSSSQEAASACSRARIDVLRVLDRHTGECYSTDSGGTVFRDDVPPKSGGPAAASSTADKPPVWRSTRERMGLVKSMLVSKEQYRRSVKEKDDYVAAAQAEIDKKKREASGEAEEEEDDDDDDDDDDDEEQAGGGNDDKEKEKEKSDGDEKKSEEKNEAKNDQKSDDMDVDKSDDKNEEEKKPAAAEKAEDETKEPSSSSSSSEAKDTSSSSDAPAPAAAAPAIAEGALVVATPAVPVPPSDGRIGKPTPNDAFCGDDPTFPEMIRRCLAVLRTVCNSPSSQPFLYPVDPQTNTRYYELVVKPISLQDVGRKLQEAGRRLGKELKEAEEGDEDAMDDSDDANSEEKPSSTKARIESEIESLVAQFARDVRQISSNCSCISGVGAALISSADEMMRIFERLLFDWCLVPDLLPLEALDDDKCVEHHVSDEEYPVLLCDGCEGKYNMNRLDPPLTKIPSGDWYCPRCVTGRCWNHVDPRIGREIRRMFVVSADEDDEDEDEEDEDAAATKTKKKAFAGTIKSSIYHKSPHDGKSGLSYVVHYPDGDEEIWTLDEVDAALTASGNPVPPVKCLEAVAESPGYGATSGPDKGLHSEPVPAYVNPLVSDLAARAVQSNTLFREQLKLTLSLAFASPEELTSREWLRLLVLLATKCSTSDVLQDWQSQLEAQSAEKMAERIANTAGAGTVKSVYEILPKVTDDEGEEGEGGASVDGDEGSEAAGSGSGSGNNSKKRKKPVLFGDESDSEEEGEKNDQSDNAGSSGASASGKSAGGGKKRRKSSVGGKSSETASAAATAASADTSSGGASSPIPKEIGGAVVKSDPATAAAGGEGDMPKSPVKPEIILSEEEIRRKNRAKHRTARQRARDECLAAVAVKQQMRATIASFEDDGFSHVVDSTLGAKMKEISLASTRCRGTLCDFCGLPDTALGTSLVRVPNHEEWKEKMCHAGGKRTCLMIAEVFDEEYYAKKDQEEKEKAEKAEKDGTEKGDVIDVDVDVDVKIEGADGTAAAPVPDSVPSAIPVKVEEKPPQPEGALKLVSVRVGGELISEKLEPADDVPERGMTEFLPRNPAGFQHELRCRERDGLPAMTGSSSAHNCCAVAAHRSRKEAAIKQHKDRTEAHADLDYSRECGRTLSVGFDRAGRSYWKFGSDPDSLFVLDDSAGSSGKKKRRWHRFREAESIASVVVCLGKCRLAEEIERLYPAAADMVRTREWVGLLQKRPALEVRPGEEEEEGGDEEEEELETVAREEKVGVSEADAAAAVGDEDESDEEQEPYEEGEEVLVESASGKLLWNAKVLSVSKDKERDRVNAYRVHYKEWGSRFDEWVCPMRVVEPSENNVIVQGEMLEEFIAAREQIPELLKDMAAKSFLKTKSRARGAVPLPDFGAIVSVGPGASFEEKVIRSLKAALLMIEAALPYNAVDTSLNGLWSPARAECWREMVKAASGPASIIGCVVLLESAISAEFFHPKAYSLISCLPRHWKAISEASTATVALRIKTLDGGIKYGASGGKKKGK